MDSDFGLLGEVHTKGEKCDGCYMDYPIAHSCGKGFVHLDYDRTEDDWDMAMLRCDGCDYVEYKPTSPEWPPVTPNVVIQGPPAGGPAGMESSTT